MDWILVLGMAMLEMKFQELLQYHPQCDPEAMGSQEMSNVPVRA